MKGRGGVSMKVAFDISPLEKGHKIRGVGNYTRNLASELKNLDRKKREFSIEFINFHDKKNELSSYEVIHYPYIDLFFISLPLLKPTKIVATIHDVTPLLFPKNYPLGLKGGIKFQIQKFLIKRIDSVITDSHASKKDIAKYLNYPKENIFPIYLGIEKHFKKTENKRLLSKIRRKYKLPSKFVLYVGDVNYNKNLVRLAEACKKLDVSLVIVGKQATVENFDRNHTENQMWVNFLKKFADDRKILRLGFVPNSELVALYNLASVYCQPSLYEGFGIPVLEAMACACPVVASNTSALLEIAGAAALFANPMDKNDISQKLSVTLTDHSLRKKLISSGFVNIKRFSWEKCAKKTLGAYKRAFLERGVLKKDTSPNPIEKLI